MTTITTLLAEVASKVGAVGKDQQVTSGPARFNFRGIDAVVNAVAGPLHAAGIIVTPTVDHVTYDTVEVGQKRTPMTVCRVVCTYTFHGPDGDQVTAQAAAEAFDSGDKATSKAMSVAYRTALLQALTLPTDEPDPDATTYERAPATPPQPDPVHVTAAEDALDEVAQAAPEFYDAKVAAKRDQLVEYASRGPDYLDTVVSRLVREQGEWETQQAGAA